ncbi:hypothetical protein C5B42_06110 [Candidatus Cerribacteria bacterium 'Amazon FNV 2010 28 9']|uniref:Uncharacterized protein n=1 Tax=Candidatus Cerribacteria bacterium 'Amazon FNV 2010 28 9' TaxID=2081795 RepID=A0A317JLF2_9BACT|nr:MAG: hypothetical protein C5B42_06110 [Candidatus Cerribacteria bacterium 'Amazon FNV 2010 28 9']
MPKIEKDYRWRDRAFHNSGKIKENSGQEEGRQENIQAAIIELQKHFPGEAITESNYTKYLDKYLKQL